MHQDTDDYRQLFIEELPLLDTRAPVEFKKGGFPNSINLPLMSDSEREQVGTCYKQNGKQAAIELGQCFGKRGSKRMSEIETLVRVCPEQSQRLSLLFSRRPALKNYTALDARSRE